MVTIPTLAVNTTVTIKASYVITQADVDAQETITNAVTTTGDEDPTPDDPTPVPVDPVPTFEVVGPEDVMYNGAEQKEAPTVTDTKTGNELTENVDYKLAYSDDVTDAGKVTITVSGIGAYAAMEPVDVTYNITPAPIKLTTGSAEKVYDGTELTEPSYEIVITQPSGDITVSSTADLVTLLGSDTLGVDITGTQTLVGSSANEGEVTWAEGKTDPILAAAIPTLAAAAAPTAKQSNYVLTATAGTLTVTDGSEDEPVDPSNVIVKTHEDGEYGLGDTVEFTITATNIYDEAKTMTITEKEGVTITGESVFENVEPGATVTTTATYTITEADILAGKFTNEVTVSFDGGKDFTNEDEVDVEDKNPHLTVTKTVTSTATTYSVGDTIEYKIVVENDGNLTITDVKVSDALTGDEWTIESLEPGAKQEFTATYTVTEADANAGKVVNTATATGTDPEGNDPSVTPGTTETPVKKPELPNTGDATNMMAMAGYAAAGLMSLAAALRIRRKEDDEQ